MIQAAYTAWRARGLGGRGVFARARRCVGLNGHVLHQGVFGQFALAARQDIARRLALAPLADPVGIGQGGQRGGAEVVFVSDTCLPRQPLFLPPDPVQHRAVHVIGPPVAKRLLSPHGALHLPQRTYKRIKKGLFCLQILKLYS